MTHGLGTGRCLRLALVALAAGSCTTRGLAYLRSGSDDAAARPVAPAAEASPDSAPLPEEAGGAQDGPPVSEPLDGATPSVEVALPMDAAPEVGEPSPRLVLESIPGTRQYGGSGGSDSSVACGPDQALIGYLGNANTSSQAVVTRLQGRCGRLAITAAPPYRVTVTEAGSLPAVGRGTANPFTALCPTNQVLVGFFGRDGLIVDQVGFRCAPLVIDLGPPAKVVHGPITTLGPWPSTKGGAGFGENCGPAAVANGHAVSAGSWIDGFGLRCTELRLVP